MPVLGGKERFDWVLTSPGLLNAWSFDVRFSAFIRHGNYSRVRLLGSIQLVTQKLGLKTIARGAALPGRGAIRTARDQILFVTQRDQRVDFRGSARRNETSQQRRTNKQQRHSAKRQRIGGGHAKEQRLDSARESQ